MKKIVVLVMTFFCLVLLSGCDMIFNNENTQEQPLIAPLNLKLFDEELTWDTVTGATGYVVLIDGVRQDILTTNKYTFDSTITEDQEISVQAYRKSKENIDQYSSSSEKVTRYKNSFSTSESVTYDFKTSEATNQTVVVNQLYEIPAAIRYVKIEGNATDTYTQVSFLVKNRNTPLVIDLMNFKAVGQSNKPALYTDAALTESWVVIINSLGQSNELKGGVNATVGTHGSDAGGIFGVGSDGGKGSKGMSGLYLPNVILKGNADIDLIGGRGGAGGDGGNGNMNFGGDGGNGGEGGSGAEFTNFYVKMNSTSTVSFQGGTGGPGGDGGNSTPLTTPPDGTTGKTGKDYVGNLQTTSGIVG